MGERNRTLMFGAEGGHVLSESCANSHLKLSNDTASRNQTALMYTGLRLAAQCRVISWEVGEQGLTYLYLRDTLMHSEGGTTGHGLSRLSPSPRPHPDPAPPDHGRLQLRRLD